MYPQVQFRAPGGGNAPFNKTRMSCKYQSHRHLYGIDRRGTSAALSRVTAGPFRGCTYGMRSPC